MPELPEVETIVMTILVHLKLSGQLIYTSPEKPAAKHTHLIFDLSNGRQIRYVDLRQFGYFLLVKDSGLSQVRQLTALGPDSLKISLDDFKGQKFHRVYQREGKSCLTCHKEKIARLKIGGRSSYFCPRCQTKIILDKE